MKLLTQLVFPLVKCHQRRLLDQKCVYTLLLNSYKSTNKSDSLTTNSHRAELDTNVKPLGQKVKETTKTASYMGIILLGVGITGTLFYAVFRELFSKNSPNNIYSAAVKKCLAEYRITDKLGSPVKAYGEETRRGRRQHPQYAGFIGRDNRKYLQMKFYLQGTAFKATVSLQMRENDAGNFDYDYMFVQIHDLSRTVIVLEDAQNPTKVEDATPEMLKF